MKMLRKTASMSVLCNPLYRIGAETAHSVGMGLFYAILPAQVYLCGLEITKLNAQQGNFT